MADAFIRRLKGAVHRICQLSSGLRSRRADLIGVIGGARWRDCAFIRCQPDAADVFLFRLAIVTIVFEVAPLALHIVGEGATVGALLTPCLALCHRAISTLVDDSVAIAGSAFIEVELHGHRVYCSVNAAYVTLLRLARFTCNRQKAASLLGIERVSVAARPCDTQEAALGLRLDSFDGVYQPVGAAGVFVQVERLSRHILGHIRLVVALPNERQRHETLFNTTDHARLSGSLSAVGR
mmetsp:Transcript_40671/g.105148  ORF Transcript_40671/g.105148 Transcript_40671/m.105148 type:complete len:238 (+) Transcript_40671:279-992(+)